MVPSRGWARQIQGTQYRVGVKAGSAEMAEFGKAGVTCTRGASGGAPTRAKLPR